jgi:DNA-directed RNA polymerase sigma subunit (sigma70/sigma32)
MPFLYSCALDVADDGAHSLEEVGEILGASPETIREIESEALRKLRRALARDRGRLGR